MKVNSRHELTIMLESQEEIDCLDYLLFCDISGEGRPIRAGRLAGLGLNDELVLSFQRELRNLMQKEGKP